MILMPYMLNEIFEIQTDMNIEFGVYLRIWLICYKYFFLKDLWQWTIFTISNVNSLIWSLNQWIVIVWMEMCHI